MLSNAGASGNLDISQVILNVKAQMQNSNNKNVTKNCTVCTWRAAAGERPSLFAGNQSGSLPITATLLLRNYSRIFFKFGINFKERQMCQSTQPNAYIINDIIQVKTQTQHSRKRYVSIL